MVKPSSPRNRSIVLGNEDRERLGASLVSLDGPVDVSDVLDHVLCQDCRAAAMHLPSECVDLLVLDPPYNLDKRFGAVAFQATDTTAYARTFEGWLEPMLRLLKPTASVYVCGDWRSSAALHEVLSRHLHVRNRITWEREKGRGAQHNWKNCAEDIWFATRSDTFTFHVDAVRLRRRVLAPYRDAAGRPKDWEDGYRDTCPSNLWTDVTVPFWSMPENTSHPTQKPEKLVAKLLLASSNPGDLVLDPFLGSGTTAVVAKKLGRRFLGIELDPDHACVALRRLELAHEGDPIQGYHDGVFWERNSKPMSSRPADEGAVG